MARYIPLLAAACLLAPVNALCWTAVGDGIEYQSFTAAGPNNLFVARMDRSNLNAIIDTSIAYDMMSGAREIVRNQAARQDDAITWWGGSWGARNDVVVAINGGFFDMYTGLITGGQIQSGWYAHWFADRYTTTGAFSGFVWKNDRTAFHGECTTHLANKVYVKYANGVTQALAGINEIEPLNNRLYIYTPQYDNRTPSGTRTEVLVEMNTPNLTTSGSGYTTGTIRSVASNTGSTWIPFDHLVLSASGDAGGILLSNAAVGASVKIYQEIYERNEPDVQGNGACQTATGADWSNAFSAINTNFHFLENGVVRVPDAVAHPGYIGYVNLNPRTAICWNSQYVFFVVCDGRTAESVGMSCEQLGNWAKNVLGATDGVNLDGGGSSTMVVNGSVVNHPSDGTERAVCNGVLMVNVLPKQQSATFSAGQTVTTAASANLRLGPGTNYGVRASLSAGQTGTVQSHSLNGVLAKGYNWWKVNFAGIVGWVAESMLVGGGACAAPAISTQPSAASVCEGSSANFSVAASGTPPLSYQWQVSTNGGASYSNVTTGTGGTTALYTTEPAASAMNGYLYRCVVTGQCSPQAVSNPAALTVSTCTTPLLVNGGFEEGSSGGVGNGWTSYLQSTGAFTIQTANPAEGSRYQQVQITTANSYGGVYQRVSGCTPGVNYTIAGYHRTNSTSATASVRVDPAGGTIRPATVNVSTTSTSFVPFSFSVTAASTAITIFLDAAVTNVNKACAFDGITISGGACVPPAAPTSASASPSSICSGSTSTLTASGGSSDVCCWYKDSCGGTPVGTGSSITVSPTSTTAYYVRRQNACGVSNCVSTTVTVSGTAPTASAGGPQTISYGGTTTALGGNTPVPPATGEWSVVSGGTGTFSSASDPNATFTHTGGIGPIVLRWTVSQPPCEPAHADLTVTISSYCLLNGDFEQGFFGGVGAGWVKVTPESGIWGQETGIKYGGTSSQMVADLTGAPSYTSWIYKTVNVKPGRTYEPTMWIYRLNAAVPRIGVDPNGGTSFIAGDAAPPQNQWAFRVHDPFTAGASGVASIGIAAGYQTNSGTVYFDDIAVRPQAPQSSGGTATITAGGSATLTASGGFGGEPGELCWYTGPNGTGVKAGTGTSLVVWPESTTTYYPRWETSGDCGISPDGPSVTVTVTPAVSPSVTGIAPSSGPNTGPVSITNLSGTGFAPGAGVRLRRFGQADVHAQNVVVSGEARITCVFDLTGKKTGLWDVVVTNPDSRFGVLANGFGVRISEGAPVVGSTISSLMHAVAVPAAAGRRFRVWGVVQTMDSSAFWLDDGSGVRIKVFAPGYAGIVNGGYASAAGTVDLSVTPPVLVCDPGGIISY